MPYDPDQTVQNRCSGGSQIPADTPAPELSVQLAIANLINMGMLESMWVRGEVSCS